MRLPSSRPSPCFSPLLPCLVRFGSPEFLPHGRRSPSPNPLQTASAFCLTHLTVWPAPATCIHPTAARILCACQIGPPRTHSAAWTAVGLASQATPAGPASH